jgi:hypothetical protein
MGFNFPASPAVGAVYPTPAIAGLPQYRWDGQKWKAAVAVAATASVLVSDTPPASPVDGQLWWESDTGALYIRYNDGDSVQWVLVGQFPTLTGLVRFDTAQTLTEPQKVQARQNVYAAPFDAMAYSGMQINGSMEISQENGQAAVPLVNGSLKSIVDGWSMALLGVGATGTGNQSTINTLPGFTNCLTIGCTAVNPMAGANDGQWAYQLIEGARWARLGWGFIAPQSVTIGFWIWPGMNGTVSVSVRSAQAPTRAYVVDVPVTASLWQYKTVTIPGCPDGTWPRDTSAAAVISICFGAGSARLTTANVWTTTGAVASAATTNFFSATGAAGTSYLTGITVLPGAEALSAARSPLIMRPYDQELPICKRYYEIPTAGGFFYPTSGGATNLYVPINWLEKRATPTCLMISSLTNLGWNSSGTGITVTSPAIFANTLKGGIAQFGGPAIAGINNFIFSADARL